MITDEFLKEKLSKEDIRFLLTKINVTNPGFRIYTGIDDNYDTLKRNKLMFESYKHIACRFKQLSYINDAIKIHELYRSLGFKEVEYRKHWCVAYEAHQKLKSAQRSMAPNEKKDNQDFYNGSGNSHDKKVRVPSLKRKTAWKRFLKLFPKYKK